MRRQLNSIIIVAILMGLIVLLMVDAIHTEAATGKLRTLKVNH
jgi:hypothetical protein